MSEAPRQRRGRGGQGGHEPRARIRSRELRAMELAIRGSSQHQIAVELGVSQVAVSKILRRVEVRTFHELTTIRGRQKARCTLRLDHLYAEAMSAWERSKADTTRRRQRKTQGGAQGNALVAELVVENEHGDPRYLEEGRKALADVSKLWGLDAPQKVDVCATRDNPYERMSDEALRERLVNRAQQFLKMCTVIPSPTALIAGETSENNH